MALSTQVVDVSNALLLLLTALPVMILLDGRMTLVSLLLVGPIILFGYFYIGKVKHLFREVDEAEGQVTRVVQENLTGLRVVRAFARQDDHPDRMRTTMPRCSRRLRIPSAVPSLLFLLAERHPGAGLAPPPGGAARMAYLQWMSHLTNTVQANFRG